VTLEELCSHVAEWLDGSGPHSDIVLSSRVRLARNLAGFPFPHRGDDLQRTRVFRDVTEACSGSYELKESECWNLESVTPADRSVFVERHLASPRLVSGVGPRGVVVAPGERLGVMVNEEDHLRIQSVTSGLNLAESLERAVRVDRELEGKLEYAVSDERGYLTACPTNVGTGLRASVLIHLPALAMAGESRKVHRAVAEMGMAVRGWFGEGSGALGDFYQLSNQRTLGRTEEEMVEALRRIAERVLELEVEARDRMKASAARRARIEDRVHRSYGTLRHARLLTVEQLMSCASDLRLGRWLGIFEGVPGEALNRLALFGQPGHLRKRSGRKLEDDEESWARAEWVRSELSAAEAG